MYRGGGGFAKPENALKRAAELINVGQRQAALKALHDVLTSKRHRQWQKALELIMFKYVELCVELKTGRLLKDGLIQYRNSCQQDNVQSLEEVIKHLLKIAHGKTEDAHAASEAAVTEVDDLDVDATPEDLMLSYVSGDSSKDRKDRKEVVPWFRFLWETYRITLDILRNNSRLEALYAMTAIKAYNFCLKHSRTTEFKRVCDIIRNHFTNLNKYNDMRDKPDLTLPETLGLYMETRFEQLNIAAKLKMWQEAFRTVEDIHLLTMIGKRSPKPQMMAIYYAKLTQVFWVSEKYLYNGYAWYKLFNISRGYNKNLQEKDLHLMATAVVLSTLSILPYDSKASHGFYETEMEREKAGRVANLLGFTVDSKRDARDALSRDALLSELVSRGVLSLAIPEVQKIHSLLESEFNPLDLCTKLESLLDAIKGVEGKLGPASPIEDLDFTQFFDQLRHVAVLKMTQQLMQVYNTVKFAFIVDKVPFYSFVQVEQILVKSMRSNYLQIKLDHRKGIVSCGTPTLESDKVKHSLSLLARRLNRAVLMIQQQQEGGSVGSSGEKQSLKRKAVEEMQSQIESEHKRILARKVIIERRKEEFEQMLQEKEREEENKRILQERMRAEEEKRRLAAESARREEERARKEMEEQDMEEAKALMEAAAARRGKKVDFKEGDAFDKAQLRQQAIQEQIKERQELARRLQRLAKSMDHFERAKRAEQVALLEKLHEKRMADDEAFQKTRKVELLAKHKKQWEANVEEKKRLAKVVEEKEAFQSMLLEKREEQYRAQEDMMRAEIAERKAEMKAQRILARKKEYVRRCREVEEHRMRIEREERLKAEREAEMKAEEERRRMYEEQRAKQMAREQEIESRGGAYQPRRGMGMHGDDRGGDRRGYGGGDRWGGGGGGGGGRPQAPYPPAQAAYGRGPPDGGDRWGRSARGPPRGMPDDRRPGPYGGPPPRQGGGVTGEGEEEEEEEEVLMALLTGRRGSSGKGMEAGAPEAPPPGDTEAPLGGMVPPGEGGRQGGEGERGEGRGTDRGTARRPGGRVRGGERVWDENLLGWQGREGREGREGRGKMKSPVFQICNLGSHRADGYSHRAA